MEMGVAYSWNFLVVSNSSTCPEIGTSWYHTENERLKMTEYKGIKSTVLAQEFQKWFFFPFKFDTWFWR